MAQIVFMEEKVVREIKVTKMEQVQDICEQLALKNSLKYNQTKAAEEASELALVLLQFANKKGKHVPDRQQLIDEIGDVVLRMDIIMNSMDISEEEVNKRIFEKASKYANWLTSGEYREI